MFTPTLVPAKEPCRLPAPIPAPHSFSLYTQMSLWPGSEERWTERPESAQTFCIVILHTSALSMALEPLSDQSGKGNLWKSKQLVFLHTF